MQPAKTRETFVSIRTSGGGEDRGTPTTAAAEADTNYRIDVETAPSRRAYTLFLTLIGQDYRKLTSGEMFKTTIDDLDTGGCKSLLEEILGQLAELRQCHIRLSDLNGQRRRFGGIVDYAEADYSTDGEIEVSVVIGKAYRELIETRAHWAKLDLIAISKFASKHSIWLYQELEKSKSKAAIKSRTWTTEELRHLLHVPTDQVKGNNNLLKEALDPAIADINAHAKFNVVYTAERGSRNSIVSVTVSWQVKPASLHTSDEDPEQDDFPKGYIKSPDNEKWRLIAEDSLTKLAGGHLPDLEVVADAYRMWTASNQIPRSEVTFASFCKAYTPK